MQRRVVRPMRSQRTPENACFECASNAGVPRFACAKLCQVTDNFPVQGRRSQHQDYHLFWQTVRFLKKEHALEKLSVTQSVIQALYLFRIPSNLPEYSASTTNGTASCSNSNSYGQPTMVTVSTFNGLLQRAPKISTLLTVPS